MNCTAARAKRVNKLQIEYTVTEIIFGADDDRFEVTVIKRASR